jgi:hypothetical protein
MREVEERRQKNIEESRDKAVTPEELK